uniref:RNA polymerase sigma factor n=1 Tax=Agathobacter sp. TaxID=2021311 RepID=UPI004056C114
MLHDEWKQIYDTYKKALYLYALSLAKNTQDAEDLLQETFVKAYLSYRNTGSIKYWLVTVLRNEFYNLQRKRKKEVLDDGKRIFSAER